MKKEEIFCNLFGFSKNTFYVWKREDRPIVELLEKYVLDSEIEEFIHYRKISKLDQIKKALPTTRKENDIELNFREIDNIVSGYNDVNSELEDVRIILADLLNYINSENSINDLETIKLYYIAKNTFIDEYEKIDFIQKNNLKHDFFINFLADLENDLVKTINIIKKENKYKAFEDIVYFVAPLLDMKYNNNYDYSGYADCYSARFGEHICKMYNLPNFIANIEKGESDGERDYSCARKDMKKEMIVGAIDSFLYKIKNKN